MNLPFSLVIKDYRFKQDTQFHVGIHSSHRQLDTCGIFWHSSNNPWPSMHTDLTIGCAPLHLRLQPSFSCTKTEKQWYVPQVACLVEMKIGCQVGWRMTCSRSHWLLHNRLIYRFVKGINIYFIMGWKLSLVVFLTRTRSCINGEGYATP